MKIAIYGKGGIGKSALAANLSAALAEDGQRVLQIGCDPKHDSTRLLLNGRVVTTVLDYMRDVPPMSQRLEDLLHTGYGGVTCAEAGGPEPGVGCAGRGILSTFALFDRLGLNTDDFDVILYDVLGDVVCGGFAVPLRKGFADRVYVVTSEEFMAVYAANNILRGVRNFDGESFRLAGLILNSRGRDEDPYPTERFAKAAGIPIVSRVPRSDRFRKAEEQNQTIIQAFPGSSESDLLRELARQIRNSPRLYPAQPLSDGALEHSFFQKNEAPFVETTGETQSVPDGAVPLPETPMALDAVSESSGLMSKSMLFREPLHGCAFTGAVTTTTQVRGSITVAHGPRSCAHIAKLTILSSGIRARSWKGLLLPRLLDPPVMSSDMNEDVVIYGGGESLRQTLRKALSREPEAVFVVTTCPSGVIGDDPHAAIRDVRTEFPDTPIKSITTDGNTEGDYMQGVLNASIEGAAELIDSTAEPEGDLVNIMAEKNIADNAESNFATLSELLEALNVGVNCRFVRNTSVDALKGFRKARLNLLAHEDHFGRVLRSYLSERLGSVFAAHPFPVGFAETERWLDDIAAFFGKADAAQELVDGHRDYYQAAIRSFRPLLEGKRLMIVCYVHDVDWILEIAFDLGMIVEKVGIFNYSQDHLFRTRFPDRYALETGYTPQKRDADLERIRPDLLLCNYVPRDLPIPLHVDGIPLCPDVGFYGGLFLARRWAALLKSPVREGWRDDGYSAG
jgi:nitrogenase iron protein NifH